MVINKFTLNFTTFLGRNGPPVRPTTYSRLVSPALNYWDKLKKITNLNEKPVATHLAL